MLEKIKRKIVQKIVNIYPSIIEEVERKKLRLIKEGLKSVGNDFYVTFPSIFNGTEHIEIGDNFKCRHMFRIEAIESYNGQQFTPSIVIGNDVQVEANCHIGAINQIVISDNVLIASNVYISDHFHGDISKKELATPPSLRKLSSKGGVSSGESVFPLGRESCF